MASNVVHWMYWVWKDVQYLGLYLLTVFLKPKYAPIKVSGTEIQNQRANMATRVPKGMAAEDPSPHRIRFITKKSANTTLSRGRRGMLDEGVIKRLCLGQAVHFYPGVVSIFILEPAVTVLPRTEEGCQQNVGLPLLSSKSWQLTKDRKENMFFRNTRHLFSLICLSIHQQRLQCLWWVRLWAWMVSANFITFTMIVNNIFHQGKQ